MSLHEGMDTCRVTSSNHERVMDTRLGHTQLLWTRGTAAWADRKSVWPLILRRASLVRNVGQCAQLRNCQSYVITRWSSIATIVLQLLSFEILSLRAESWSFVRQTSDLFDEESFWIRNSKWLPSLLACSWTFLFQQEAQQTDYQDSSFKSVKVQDCWLPLLTLYKIKVFINDKNYSWVGQYPVVCGGYFQLFCIYSL